MPVRAIGKSPPLPEDQHATSICGAAAADLARHGLTGPPTVLEGRFGFLQAFCGDRAHPDAVVRGMSTDWELPRVVFKPYPCDHFTHAGVDAALRLRAQGLAPADVTAIKLGVAKPVLTLRAPGISPRC